MFLAGIEARSIIRTDEPLEPEILQKLATAGKSSSGYSTMDIYSDIDSRVNNSLQNTLIQIQIQMPWMIALSSFILPSIIDGNTSNNRSFSCLIIYTDTNSTMLDTTKLIH